MAKRVKAGNLDESLIIQVFKDTALLADPADAIAEQPEEEVSAGESDEDQEQPDDNTAEAPVDNPVPKNKPRRKRGDYNEVFLKKKELKTRQPVYISLKVHKEIIKLVHLFALMDKEISVGGYIDNVLTEHLEQHKEEISELYHNQMNDLMQTHKSKK